VLSIEDYKKLINDLQQELNNKKVESQKIASRLPSRWLIAMGAYIICEVLWKIEFANLLIYFFGAIAVLFTFLSFSDMQNNPNFYFKEKGLANALKEYETIKQIVDDKQPYILYLRDFRGAATYFVSEYGFKEGKDSSDIMHYFMERYPVITLGFISDETPYSFGLRIYADEHSWFSLFQYLLKSSKYVIADFDFLNLGAGMKSEIQELEQLNSKKIIFLGNRQNLKMLNEKYSKMAKNVILQVKIKISNRNSNYYGVNIEEFDKIDSKGNLES